MSINFVQLFSKIFSKLQKNFNVQIRDKINKNIIIFIKNRNQIVTFIR